MMIENVIMYNRDNIFTNIVSDDLISSGVFSMLLYDYDDDQNPIDIWADDKCTIDIISVVVVIIK